MARSLQIPMKKLEEWANRIRFDLDEAVNARAEWLEDCRRSTRTIRMIPPGEKVEPWQGCSNIITPHTMMQYEQNVRRLVMYFVADREYVNVLPNSAAIEASNGAKDTEDLLRWQAENPLDYWNFVDNFVRDFCGTGTGIGQGGWTRDLQTVAEVLVLGREKLMEKSPGSGSPVWVQQGEKPKRDSTFDQIAREIFSGQNMEVGANRIIKGTPKDLEIREVRYREKGKVWQKARVTIDRAEELGDDIEVICEKRKLVKNQPFFRALMPERVLVPPGDHDIDEAPWVSVKFWATWEFLQKKMGQFGHRKEWNLSEGQMREIQDIMVDDQDPGFTRKYHGASQEDGQFYEEFALQEDTDEYVGVDSEVTRSRKIPILEFMGKWPILKGSDELCNARIVYLPTMNMIAWVHHEGAVGLSDRRSLVSHNFAKNRGQFYGSSLPRTMESIQEQADAVTNMELDAAAITTNPVLFINHTTTLPRDNQTYYPGAVFRSAEPPTIPNWPSRIGEFEAIQNRIASMAQMVGRQSEASVGMDAQRPQGNRTARGAQILLSEKNFNIAYDGESLVRPVTSTFRIIHAYDQMYLPEGFEFRMLGTDTVRTVGRYGIRGDFDFKFEAGRAVQNDEMRRLLFTEFTQLIAPLAQAMGEQVPEPMHNLYEDLGKKYGIKNVARYLPAKVDGVGDTLTPSIEHQFFLHGRPVSVHPNDIDQHHVQAHLAFVESEAFESMDRRMVGPFKQHVLEHMKRAQSAQSAGQSAPGQTGVQVAGPLGMTSGGNPAVPAGPGQPPVGEPNRAANGAPLSSIGRLGG